MVKGLNMASDLVKKLIRTWDIVKKAHNDMRDDQKRFLFLIRGSKRLIMASEMVKRLIMTSEMVNKAYYDMRDGQKGSILLKRWSKRLIMTLEMEKRRLIMIWEMVKKAHYYCHRFTLVRTRRFRLNFEKFLFDKISVKIKLIHFSDVLKVLCTKFHKFILTERVARN